MFPPLQLNANTSAPWRTFRLTPFPQPYLLIFAEELAPLGNKETDRPALLQQTSLISYNQVTFQAWLSSQHSGTQQLGLASLIQPCRWGPGQEKSPPCPSDMRASSLLSYLHDHL